MAFGLGSSQLPEKLPVFGEEKEEIIIETKIPNGGIS